jgi:mannose-1-phosphate guanylyltransferase / phosphomannomutase
VAVPVTVTSRVEEIAEPFGLEVVRTPAAPAELSKAAIAEDIAFAGATGGVYVFPKFLPGYDAVASLCTLLELLSHVEKPVSELVGELPASHVVHRQIACPWALKGLVMRVLSERLKDRELDLTDGIKVLDERGWVEVLPDPDEPLVHVYAEGRNGEVSAELEAELHALVDEAMAGQESTVGAQISS